MAMRGGEWEKSRVVSAYRVSQDSPAQAGEITSCKQLVRVQRPVMLKIPMQKMVPIGSICDDAKLASRESIPR